MTGPRIAALVLAAGSSRRMGANKLLATIGDRPLVRYAAEAAVGSLASSVVVVTGHEANGVVAALSGLPVATAFNPRHGEGMASSLAAGLAQVPADADGVVVLLGDMPRVDATVVDSLIRAFRPGRIVVPISNGQRGNPVLWPRDFFERLRSLTGDVGGRGLIDGNRAAVIEVAQGAAVVTDADTPEALAAMGGKLR